MKPFVFRIRLYLLCLLVAAVSLVCFGQLYQMQVSARGSAPLPSERRFYKTETVPASRGEILDRYGRKLVTNEWSTYVALDAAALGKSNEIANASIGTLIALCEQTGTDYNDSLPISTYPPFRYADPMTDRQKARLDRFLSRMEWDEPGADALFENLRTLFEIEEELDDVAARKIIGVRYELELRRLFNDVAPYRFASGIGIELVTAIQERAPAGVRASQEAIRVYNTDFAAHILGRVTSIQDGEYAALRELGYALDDTVGREGMEEALEQYLRGVNGKRTVETNAAGRVTNIIEDLPAQPGSNCLLTLDLRLQEAVEIALAKRMAEFKERGEDNPGAIGAEADAAAVVVLDVKTAEVLAMASYPTFSLLTYSADYAALSADPARPYYNRAISGTYAPGSTMKMSTALAVLEQGVVTPSTRIEDRGVYTAYAASGYTPMCGTYRSYGYTCGALTAADAIKVSCNYYFYDAADRCGIGPLVDMSRLLGLGQPTGIELPAERTGVLAGPEDRESRGMRWNPGDTLQAAIGQSENLFTPLQMANYVATLANGGTRRSVHLLKSVKSSDYNRQQIEITPTVLDTLDVSTANWRSVMEGMRAVCQPGGSASAVFSNYPVAVAGKTGSAQVGGKTNGVFVSFAPYQDPEIAVMVIVEKGDAGHAVAPIARDVYDAYFALSSERQTTIPELELLR